MGKNYGITSGFSGRLGPVVGYNRLGVWCLRTLPTRVHNPRTARQQAHRKDFRRQVALAAELRNAVLPGLQREARQQGLTAYNLFVRLNHRYINAQEVQWERLRVAAGPAAPVRIVGASVDNEGVLEVRFEKNPMGRSCSGSDLVRMYVHCPATGKGMRCQLVARRAQRASLMLPEDMLGEQLEVYAYAEDVQGRMSDSCHASVSERLAAGSEVDLEGDEGAAAGLVAAEEAAAGAAASSAATTPLRAAIPPS